VVCVSCLVVSEGTRSPKRSCAVDTPPSDDCPEDDDDTPTPPAGGDEPCGFDCWEPPPEDDDPFDPPGFTSVQSWQTTSTGMAVTVYQPASADCPEDGDNPPPCDEKDFGDPELQALMESSSRLEPHEATACVD
jgi:hypothetical protein